jgi:transposase
VPGAAAAGLAAQKKRLIAAERDEAARAAWRAAAAALDPAALVFVDETGAHTALTRLRARAPRGERAVGAAPRNPGPNRTLLAALTPRGIGPALLVEGAADAALFAAYVERCLVPALRPGQTVVLDNLSVHKGERIRALVEGAGGRVLFLPSYSPDFNPIEPAFAKVKAHLRRAAARTRDDLVAATGAARDAVTPQDARGFFAHRGYPLPDQH